MRTKNTFLISFALLFQIEFYVYAQHKEDSLRNILALATTDSTRIQALNQLAFSLRRNHTEEAIQLSNEAIALAEKQKRYEDLTIAYKNLGLAYNYQLKNAEALETFYTAVQLCDTHGFTSLKANILINIGNIYAKQKQPQKAKGYYQESLKAAQSVGDKSQEARALGSLGNMSKIPEEAITYLTQAAALFEELNNQQNLSVTYTNLAKIYTEKEDYKKAIMLNRLALAIDRQREDAYAISFSYSNLGNIYRKLNQYDSALFYLRQVENIAKELNSLNRHKIITGKLYLLYKDMGNLKQALAYHEMYYALSDSIYNKQKNDAVAEIEAKYNEELKNQEIILLKSQNDFNKAELSKKNTELVVLITALIILLLLGIGIYLRYTEKNQLTQQLKEQKEELELSANRLKKAQKSVESTNKELKELNFSLEEKVNARTEKLNQTYQDLFSAHEQLDYFTYRSAHDLKGPIARLMGLCHLISSEQQHSQLTEATLYDYLAKLEETGNEMNYLLNRILEIHELKQKKTEFTLCKPVELVNTVVNTFSQENPKVSFSVKGSMKEEVYTDALHVSRAIENLVSNSLNNQHSERPLEIAISIEAKPKKGQMEIEVIDNGNGIDLRLQKDIFKMFISGNNDYKKPGLGLYEAKLLLSKIGGEIYLNYSIAGETSFSVVLPLALL